MILEQKNIVLLHRETRDGSKEIGGKWYDVGAADRVRPEDCLEGERTGSWGSF